MAGNGSGNTDQTHAQIAARVREGGKAFTEATVAAFGPLYGALHTSGSPEGITVDRDISYGPGGERNLLDVHAFGDSAGKRPVVIFFHGGGLVRGDKAPSGSPFYGNIANFFAANGVIGVNATYRLAPAIQWPEGSRDVGAALAWARDNISRYGGDPERIVLMGHSAGATHVANYVFRKELHPSSGPGFVGAILMSGVYGIDGDNPPPNHLAYYGSDRSQYAQRQMNGNVDHCDFPVLMTVAEYDPVRFESGAFRLLAELAEKSAPRPRIRQFLDHNHITPAFAIGTGDAEVEGTLLDFLRTFG
ncbi:MAG: alpha/beta hydrolase [Hyphomicrobiales bacterium]|nr:alpha/beta hydrolase [Hyphomicrobiales bacterium]